MERNQLSVEMHYEDFQLNNKNENLKR